MKEITVAVGRTISTGNKYEFLRVDVSATSVIVYDLGETEDTVREKMSLWLKQQMRKTIAEQGEDDVWIHPGKGR
jgi:hypothetical protein